MREFNISGHCIQSEDYMVDISDKLRQIAELVYSRKYFVINCPRQYGKTTTLLSLKQFLKDEYIVASITFEKLGYESFKTSVNFCLSFMRRIKKSLKSENVSDEYKEAWFNKDVTDIEELSDHIDEMCKNQKVVLMIDEVDKVKAIA